MSCTGFGFWWHGGTERASVVIVDTSVVLLYLSGMGMTEFSVSDILARLRAYRAGDLPDCCRCILVTSPSLLCIRAEGFRAGEGNQKD